MGLPTYVATAQVRFDGIYEATLLNLRWSYPRGVTMTAMMSGQLVTGIGAQKPTLSFERPILKDDAQQVPAAVLDGPCTVNVILSPTLTLQFVGWTRGPGSGSVNPDAGVSTESYEGPATAMRRI